jgi:hypothetical protein
VARKVQVHASHAVGSRYPPPVPVRAVAAVPRKFDYICSAAGVVIKRSTYTRIVTKYTMVKQKRNGLALACLTHFTFFILLTHSPPLIIMIISFTIPASRHQLHGLLQQQLHGSYLV